VPFGQRLIQCIEALRPPRTQAWVAEETGIPTSSISRLISGTRNPTPAVIESLAPVLGLEPGQLVAGTDAEARYLHSGDFVKKEIYEAAAQQLAVDQFQIAELQEQLAAFPSVSSKLGETLRELDLVRRDASELRTDNKQLRSDMQRYRHALEQAVAAYSTLQGQLKTLADELSDTRKSSRASAILAAVGAFTGAVTVTHFLAKASESKASPSDRTKKKPRKAKPNG